jgi:RNA polymerase sigma-70 factor (ECF subfamily)
VDRLAQFTELRPQLFALAYRMMGTRTDAEDVLQDSYLRWHEAPSAEILSPKSYLTTIVARLSLDALKSAHRKRELYTGPWLPEPLIGAAMPDTIELAESLSFAFLHLLETLTPAERIAFLLHEVFETPYAEIAKILDTSLSNARQLATRARKRIREKRARFIVDRARHQAVFNQFLTACSNGDWAALVGLLHEDAVLYSDAGGKRSSTLRPIYGAERIVRLLKGIASHADPDLAAGHSDLINGAPGFVFTRDRRITCTTALDIDENGLIRAIFTVMNPEKLHAETIVRT